ncbi:MAG TPA: aminodeoxychorismate synthase component I [Thermodesulfobacteriaceae bacterium]|nr:aminodeoxychorismate synthase component I [Thermodesulfobacteriaceae bacterium]
MKVSYKTGTVYPPDAAGILEQIQHSETVVFLETSRVTAEEDASYLFTDPVGQLSASGPEDIPALYEAIDQALDKGYWLAGWWSYEWGYALEPILHGLLASSRAGRPLVWLGIFRSPRKWRHRCGCPPCADLPVPGFHGEIGDLRLDTDRDSYIKAIESIKQYIAMGHTYQVNYTVRGSFSYSGRPVDLYRAMKARQAVSYGAVIKNGSRWILSLSPELFFRRDGARIWSKPMKGTVKRGVTVEEDMKFADFLANDPKNRAENVMIVDLLRNDIGRLSIPGTVRVTDLFTIERYETLFQMISRIEGRLADGIGWMQIFKALFPCGSVTGAPKIRTMEIISELETSPRGIYTGSIGFLAPGGKAVLSVAIRTAVLEKGAGELGIGSGITMDSEPSAEYDECMLKAGFLAGLPGRAGDASCRSERSPSGRSMGCRKKSSNLGPGRFLLIETMRWEPGRETEKDMGYFLLERHLERLAMSAHYFSFHMDRERIEYELRVLALNLKRGGRTGRVRLLLGQEGNLELTVSPLEPEDEPVCFDVSRKHVDSRDLFLYHKTTRRKMFDRELREARAAGLFETVFVNQKGELTEGTITNIFAEIDRELLTPPVGCGLLNGTLRRELMECGQAKERILYPEDLETAGAIYLGNSVRGLLRARMKRRGR